MATTCDAPHVLMMQWRPGHLWSTLNVPQQLLYLRSLNERIKFGESMGMVVLGWSKVDMQIPKSPSDLWVGVFGFQSKQQINDMLSDVSKSKWYDYFDTTNIVIELKTAEEPHLIYSKLLGISNSC